MNEQMVIFLARETITVALIIAGPVLIGGMAVGLIVAIFQAVTQLREMTIVMVPKILAVAGLTFWLLPWMISELITYTYYMLSWARYYGG